MTKLVRLPGTYRAQDDTWLLADVLRRTGLTRGRRVLGVHRHRGAGPRDRARPGTFAAGLMMAGMTSPRETRVVLTGEGPVLVEGPLQVELPDGSVVRSERPVVALCACRRSKRYPFCDTSHRQKVRARRRTDDGEEPA